jgi:C4-type Zn-finger protein
MANKKSYHRKNLRETKIKCPCGGTAILITRKNYPFGKKSKAVRVSYYKCQLCSLRTNAFNKK